MSDRAAAKSVLETILYNCQLYKDKTALSWVNEDGDIAESLTYYELNEYTQRTALGLMDLLHSYTVSGPGQRVLLCYPPGLKFILTFIACLRAGLITVPVCPPSNDHTRTNLKDIATDCCAVFGLTSQELVSDPVVAEIMGSIDLSWHTEIVVDDEEQKSSASDLLPTNEEGLPPSKFTDEQLYDLDQCSPNDIIMLQYTSNSTGTPKGLMMTNESLLHNLELMTSIKQTNQQTIELNFLPHYELLSLFYSYLQPLCCGATGYHMSPSAFTSQPAQWIKYASVFRATHSQITSSALEIVLRDNPPQDIDLSSMECIIVTQPFYQSTLHKFENEFASFGLRENTIRTTYCLEESSMCVQASSNPLASNDRISYGVPCVPDVKVVDPSTCTEVEEGRRGELWVANRLSVSPGYWGITANTQATLNNNSSNKYIRTGDVGYTKNGQLFLLGPNEDVVTTSKGQKLHPADIELSMEAQFKFLQPGSTVACSYGPDNTDLAYIAPLGSTQIPTHEQLESYCNTIAIRMSSKLKVKPALIAITLQNSMPHAIFSKKQRTICKRRLVENSFPVLFKWTPPIKEPTRHISSAPSSPTLIEEEEIPSPNKLLGEKSKTKTTKKKGHQDITPIDLMKQFNCELDTKPDMILSPAKMSGRSRIASLDQAHFKFDIDLNNESSEHNLLPILQVPVIVTEKSNKLMIPMVTEPTIPFPQTKVRKSSRAIPTITADLSIEEQPTTGKSFIKHQLDLANLLNARDILRRKSAPPHEMNAEGKRIEEDIRRTSMQERKVMMIKKQQKNTIQALTKSISKVLGVQLQPTSNIWACGCDSFKAVQLSKSFQLDFGFNIEPNLFYIHQTPLSLLGNFQRRLLMLSQINHEEKEKAGHMREKWRTQSLDRNILRRKSSVLPSLRRMSLPRLVSDDAESSSTVSSSDTSLKSDDERAEDIAIVGMAGSYAGCNGTQELWNTLLSQQVQTTPLIHNHAHFTEGFSTVTGQVDHKFFGLSEYEASIIDPRHAMLLHTAWECLHNSGQGEPLVQNKGYEWGVFVGISYKHSEATLTNNAAVQIARVFDLVGPVLTVDSSLCALDAACLSLNAGNCTAALVCGVDTLLTRQNLDIKGPNVNSDYVASEGASALLLIPLDNANRQSKRIHAVIKSTATNNNGAMSTTTPLTRTLTQLLNKALAKSNISLSAMRYIELANAVTLNGLQAIQSVYGLKQDTGTDKTTYLGSLQANIGHLEVDAGLASTVKTVLVLEHSQIPGTPLIETSQVALCSSHGIQRPSENVTDPFPATLKACAIVNSFQCQGSNATAVLQQYTALPHMAGVRGGLLLLMDTLISTDLNETISTLENTFPQFLQVRKVCKKIHTLTKEFAMFKLFRVIATILTALGVTFSVMGGVDMLGEILALAISGAIKDSQAMKLISTHKSEKSCPTTISIQDSISKPSTDILSSVLEKVCHSSEYKTELKSKKYALKFVSMLRGECSDSDQKKASKISLIKMLNQTIEDQPLLILASTDQLTEIEHAISNTPHVLVQLCNSTSTQYIRQKCMEFRNLSDALKLKACTSKPSTGPGWALPHFTESYPLRAAAASKINTQNTDSEVSSKSTLESETSPLLQNSTKTEAISSSTLGNKLRVNSTKSETTKSRTKILCQDCQGKEEI